MYDYYTTKAALYWPEYVHEGSTGGGRYFWKSSGDAVILVQGEVLMAGVAHTALRGSPESIGSFCGKI